MTAAHLAPTHSPAQIYIIRHGEKPSDPPTTGASAGPPFGIDAEGNQDPHALLPRGWQRSGALAVLFAPAHGPLQAGLRPPTQLFAPDYGKSEKTESQRCYQTIQGLSGRLTVPIDTPFAEGQESALADAVIAGGADVVLICWEHHHIPAIAAAVPCTPASQVPAAWPGDRFDIIWSFSRQNAGYQFTQIPQQLLAGDTATTV